MTPHDEDRHDGSPRRRGRPPATVPGVAVGTWIPAPQYDRLLRLAARRDTSVSALLRRLVHKSFTTRGRR